MFSLSPSLPPYYFFSIALCRYSVDCTVEKRLASFGEIVIKIKPFILFSSFLIQTLYLSINHSYGSSQIPSFQLYSSPKRKKMNKPMSIFRGQSHAFPGFIYYVCRWQLAHSINHRGKFPWVPQMPWSIIPRPFHLRDLSMKGVSEKPNNPCIEGHSIIQTV